MFNGKQLFGLKICGPGRNAYGIACCACPGLYGVTPFSCRNIIHHGSYNLITASRRQMYCNCVMDSEYTAY
jgi:hypothetical protein